MKSKDKNNITDHLNEYDFKKLKLKFLDKDEIKIFSTLCQDSIFSVEVTGKILKTNINSKEYLYNESSAFGLLEKLLRFKKTNTLLK